MMILSKSLGRLSILAIMALPIACDGLVEDHEAADEFAQTQGAYDGANDGQAVEVDPDLMVVQPAPSTCLNNSEWVGEGGITNGLILWEDFFGFDYDTGTYLAGSCRVHEVAEINNKPNASGTNKLMSYFGVAAFPRLETGLLRGADLSNAIETCEAAYLLFEGYEHDNDNDSSGDHFISKVVYATAQLQWNATGTRAKIISCQASYEEQVASWSVDSVKMVVRGISLDTSDIHVASRVRWINEPFE